MRLFVALSLPAKERERIFRQARPLRDAGFPVRWIEVGLFHLTLKFLGEVHPQRVDQATKILDRVASGTSVFDVRLSGVGAFPTLRSPQVLWLGADPSPALRCLKHDVEWGLAEAGFTRETRAFHPHLTLGRTPGEVEPGAFRSLEEVAAGITYEGHFVARKLDLMSSELSRQGPRYTIVSRSDLSTGG
jgi:2'-5' RNA ligase